MLTNAPGKTAKEELGGRGVGVVSLLLPGWLFRFSPSSSAELCFHGSQPPPSQATPVLGGEAGGGAPRLSPPALSSPPDARP